MTTNRGGIGEKARKEPKLVFTSLFHHIADIDNLRDCYNVLPKDRAVGVDGETKEEYGKDLERNLQDLSRRLREGAYKPKPKRRTTVPKPGSKEGRPLGISSFEDKIVELAVKQVLEPIYETIFEECSYGYRPERSAHQCLGEMGRTIQQKRISYVVEADIRRFFDTVNHDWLIKFLEHRIGDPRVIQVIRRMLKGGIMEGGLVKATDEGTPQGSILSPLLSNIYLHYVLDLWFKIKVQRQYRGESYLVRFADDFLACFQYRGDAERFRGELEVRLHSFGMKLAEEKTRCIEFGRFARENAKRSGRKPEEFTFLGVTHYSGKTKTGHFKVKRRTSRKKLGQSLRKLSDWAMRARNVLRKGEMLRRAKMHIQGHLNYYAITDNSKQCNLYVHHATRIIYKWINRKSQRRAYTWREFNQVITRIGWPKSIIRIDLSPYCRAEAR